MNSVTFAALLKCLYNDGWSESMEQVQVNGNTNLEDSQVADLNIFILSG